MCRFDGKIVEKELGVPAWFIAHQQMMAEFECLGREALRCRCELVKFVGVLEIVDMPEEDKSDE